jgi:type VI secretion system protein ImpG
MCTNRDLPLHMSIGRGTTDFTLDSGAPVQAIRCVAGPSPPRQSHAHGDTSWRIISHLSLNYLSLTNTNDAEGASTLRELLRLYADLSDGSARKQIDGVRFIESQPITRRLPVAGPTVFGRGVEIALTFDEAAFEGTGVYLLGSVLARFFARTASINSFTETTLSTIQRGEITRWPIQVGVRPTL